MFSVFDGRYRDLTNFTSDDYLHINSCGVSYMIYNEKPRSVRFYRPDGRVDYHFLLVTEGSLLAICDGKEYKLQRGDALFYKPNDLQCYTVEVDETNTNEAHLYIHFCGKVVEEVLQKAGFCHSRPIFGTASEVKRIFELLIRNHRSGDDMTAVGNLLRLVALLSPKNSKPQNESERSMFREAEFISNHYTDEIDLNECAMRCGLSRSRFTHLFTQTVGTSPLQYQQQLRLEQACELLRSSTLSVGEISDGVGFRDALYFSRIFKKKTGLTPSDYRKGHIK